MTRAIRLARLTSCESNPHKGAASVNRQSCIHAATYKTSQHTASAY